MNIVYGDLLDLMEAGRFDVMVHGCNCMHTMGAGIAKQIKQRWPEVYAADLQTERSAKKLGELSMAYVIRNGVGFWVVNGYTQIKPGPHVDLVAIEQVFEMLQEDFFHERIAYPKIGAGLGGGDWAKISSIIDIALKGENHTLVALP